jgi:hypothetical protein
VLLYSRQVLPRRLVPWVRSRTSNRDAAVRAGDGVLVRGVRGSDFQSRHFFLPARPAKGTFSGRAPRRGHPSQVARRCFFSWTSSFPDRAHLVVAGAPADHEVSTERAAPGGRSVLLDKSPGPCRCGGLRLPSGWSTVRIGSGRQAPQPGEGTRMGQEDRLSLALLPHASDHKE